MCISFGKNGVWFWLSILITFSIDCQIVQVIFYYLTIVFIPMINLNLQWDLFWNTWNTVPSCTCSRQEYQWLQRQWHYRWPMLFSVSLISYFKNLEEHIGNESIQTDGHVMRRGCRHCPWPSTSLWSVSSSLCLSWTLLSTYLLSILATGMSTSSSCTCKNHASFIVMYYDGRYRPLRAG